MVVSEKRLLFLDTETGGLDPDEHALLTIGYAITDLSYNILETREYKLPIKGTIQYEALVINGLDVTDWMPDNTLSAVIDEIAQLTAGTELTLYGQNVIAADLQFIRSHDKEAYQRLWFGILQRRFVDTKSQLQYLVDRGRYTGSTSLHSFVADERVHTALGDVFLTIEAVKKINHIIDIHTSSSKNL